MGLLPQSPLLGMFLLFLFAEPLSQTAPSAALWTIPAILISAMMIAWAAESAQYFVAQGFALAMLAWLQTLPEFAAEAVLAWHREVPFLLAGLTGALRMLTGLGWPMIYATAAYMHRKRGDGPLRAIRLHGHQAVEVTGLLAPLLYFGVIAIKNSLSVWDAIPLMGIYSAYLWVLSKLPPEDPETIDDLEAIPRKIVLAPRGTRIAAITGLFVAGGVLIQQSTAPFVGSLFSLSFALGVPTFVFMQWVMPLVSEFPEMASTFYWAKTVDRAPMALMNMVSSNINQWTMLPAMLPIVLSISARTVTPITFDPQQKVELLMTIGQAAVGMMFLINMELAWWEAATLFVFFLVPYFIHALAVPVTIAYFVWAGVELIRLLIGARSPAALREAHNIWKEIRHVKGNN